jgi:acyl-CoA thioesterase-2
MDQDQSVLGAALIASLDATLAALALEPKGDGWFETPGAPTTFNHIYGGQLLGQAIMAASATVPDKPLHSLHAYFIRGGDPRQTLRIQVEALRDGRNVATRRVNVFQQERLLFSLMASFHQSLSPAAWEAPPPAMPGLEDTRTIQQWAAQAPAHLRQGAESWISRPPPVEFRLAEPPRFMGGPGPAGDNLRTHWMRLPKSVGDDPALHQALLAYCSDYLLMDMVFRYYPGFGETASFSGMSLDHSLWFHRPVRFDQWHAYSQSAWTIVGERGLARGEMRNAEGQLIATAAQEVLVIPPRGSET